MGGWEMSRYKADDMSLLLPSFRAKMLLVVDDMLDLGHDIVVFDTGRSKREAAKNAARGVGRPNSIHCYGGACDCICGKHGWSCRAHGCSFFEDYGRVVEKHGLVWGGNFDRDPSTDDRLDDRPHAQGMEVKDQNRFRALRTAAERDAFIAARLCKP